MIHKEVSESHICRCLAAAVKQVGICGLCLPSSGSYKAEHITWRWVLLGKTQLIVQIFWIVGAGV